MCVSHVTKSEINVIGKTVKKSFCLSMQRTQKQQVSQNVFIDCVCVNADRIIIRDGDVLCVEREALRAEAPNATR